MNADPICVVENWLALPEGKRAQLSLGQMFGQVRLDVLDDIREEASRRPGPFWADVARLAELVSSTRLMAAGYLPQEVTADLPARDIIEADSAYLKAEGLLV